MHWIGDLIGFCSHYSYTCSQLPHPLTSSNTEVCLFTKDLKDKSIEDSTEHFNDLLKEKNVSGIGEVSVIPAFWQNLAYLHHWAGYEITCIV